MIINELFDGHPQLEQIDPQFAQQEYGLVNVAAAYLLPLKDQEFVFFFENGYDGRYSFSYGKAIYGKNGLKKLTYFLTKAGDQFKIIPAAMHVLEMFISKYNPSTVTFSGAQTRQDKFYARLIPYMKRKFGPTYRAGQGPSGRFIITRDPKFHLAEDAQGDVSNLQRAEEIAHKFGKWMAKANEDTPLANVSGIQRRRIGAGEIFYANGTLFGEDYDLNIGFYWNTTGAIDKGAASMFNGRDGSTPVYYIALSAGGDPRKATDLMFTVRWQHLIHEITHYLDRKRQTTREPNNKLNGLTRGADSSKGPAHYYNHPLEFNAFFQQGLHEVMATIARPTTRVQTELRTFQSFLDNYLMDFDHGFRANLNPEYQQKFKRRLYKLYEFLLTKFASQSEL